MLKSEKKGTGYFFPKKEDSLYSQTLHKEKVSCPLFYLFYGIEK